MTKKKNPDFASSTVFFFAESKSSLVLSEIFGQKNQMVPSIFIITTYTSDLTKNFE